MRQQRRNFAQFSLRGSPIHHAALVCFCAILDHQRRWMGGLGRTLTVTCALPKWPWRFDTQARGPTNARNVPLTGRGEGQPMNAQATTGRAHLVAGFPTGSAAGHDPDHARIRLLGLLAGHAGLGRQRLRRRGEMAAGQPAMITLGGRPLRRRVSRPSRRGSGRFVCTAPAAAAPARRVTANAVRTSHACGSSASHFLASADPPDPRRCADRDHPLTAGLSVLRGEPYFIELQDPGIAVAAAEFGPDAVSPSVAHCIPRTRRCRPTVEPACSATRGVGGGGGDLLCAGPLPQPRQPRRARRRPGLVFHGAWDSDTVRADAIAWRAHAVAGGRHAGHRFPGAHLRDATIGPWVGDPARPPEVTGATIWVAAMDEVDGAGAFAMYATTPDMRSGCMPPSGPFGLVAGRSCGDHHGRRSTARSAADHAGPRGRVRGAANSRVHSGWREAFLPINLMATEPGARPGAGGNPGLTVIDRQQGCSSPWAAATAAPRCSPICRICWRWRVSPMARRRRSPAPARCRTSHSPTASRPLARPSKRVRLRALPVGHRLDAGDQRGDLQAEPLHLTDRLCRAGAQRLMGWRASLLGAIVLNRAYPASSRGRAVAAAIARLSAGQASAAIHGKRALGGAGTGHGQRAAPHVLGAGGRAGLTPFGAEATGGRVGPARAACSSSSASRR